MEYDNLQDWINYQYKLSIKMQNEITNMILQKREKLEKEKLYSTALEIEYLEKEKQITTFLQCKKSFFGKFKYFFKYGKSKKLNLKNKSKEKVAEPKKIVKSRKIEIDETKNYELEELLENYKQYETLENEIIELSDETKNILIKNRNLRKKIENATLYIKEIDSHKKSIFEFWKYSNKDEVSVLPEGEMQEVNVIKNVKKSFDYIEDFEGLAKRQDRLQRKILTKEEKDAIYIASTELLPLLNKIKNLEALPKDIESSLKQLIKQLRKQETSNIFENNNMRKHTEKAKNKFEILDINKTTKALGYKLTLETVVENIKMALNKTYTPIDISIYRASSEEDAIKNNLDIFSINPETEIENINKLSKNTIDLYKINLKEKANMVFFTNSIFYDNENKTLPVGMNLSNNVLIDLSKLQLELAENFNFRFIELEDEKDDFTKSTIKTVNVFEYNIKPFKCIQ